MKKNDIILFAKGIGNSDFYRIPSIIKTASNVLVCACDERYFTNADNPNKINKIIRRSFDNGMTWGKVQTVVAETGESQSDSSAAIDPAMVFNPNDNSILMLYSHTPAKVGLYNSIASVGGDENGVEIPTSYLMLTKSYDDGLTWSKSICLNSQIKDKNWGFIGAGPGVGVYVPKGDTGRIIFPIYYGMSDKQPSLMACAIYSDDNGLTWRKGQPVVCYQPNQFEKNRMKSDDMQFTEGQIVNNGDGAIDYYLRNHNPVKRIARVRSFDGGETWGQVEFMQDMPQPICQVSAIDFCRDGKNCIAVLNPADENQRINGTLRLSEDGGKTFSYKYLVKEGQFIYSSLVYIEETDEIGIAYEPDWQSIMFCKIGVSEIKKNAYVG